MKILVIFCGGTIVMNENDEGSLQPLSKERAIQSLLNIEPKISQMVDLKIEYLDNIDSTNMNPQHWEKMITIIKKNYQKFDGFVITHGTDTMAYTSSALSFAIQDLGKPVVLTGSQIPGNKMETDARRNFINAIRLATLNIAGVFLVFDERIILGSRASKTSESELDAYSTINDDDIGQIRIEIRLSKKITHRHNKNPKFISGFESDISIVTLTPGSDPTDLLHLLELDKIKGLIILGYGPGNIPYEYYKVFEKARDKKIPVVVSTQCLNGSTTMKYYDVGAQALKLGVIESLDMSLEATAVKLMWAITNFSFKEIPRVMHQNLAGEIKNNKNLVMPHLNKIN